MAWYYQPTPHDTHDWDAAQTPILIDGVIDGKPRKLIAQANRNGHFFLLDRTNGQHILTEPFIDSLELDERPRREGPAPPGPGQGSERAEDPRVADHRRRHELAASELQPRHRPLLRRHHAGIQLLLPDRHRPAPAGLGGGRAPHHEPGLRSSRPSTTRPARSRLEQAPGQSAWGRGRADGPAQHRGKLLFGNDGGGHFVAYDAGTGKPLWHAGLGKQHDQRPPDLPARRPAVRGGRRGRSALRVTLQQ